MQKINIAGLRIGIIHNKPLLLDKFNPYTCLKQDHKEVDVYIKVKASKSIDIPKGELVLNDSFKWVKSKDESNSSSVYICREEPNDIAYLLNTNNEWNNAEIIYQENHFNAECAVTGPLVEILFRNSLIYNKGLVLHASAVQYEEKGIIFSAPSETGKTTQARLWCNNMGAVLINNDRPAVRIIDNIPYVYGTPWSGVSSECNNNVSKLEAIVMLEQSDENCISKLTKEEAIRKLMPRCFLPYYDEDIMKIALDNLENLLKSTQVYLLKCRPDIGAVQEVYKAIWRNNV